jgi:hypothetical protein
VWGVCVCECGVLSVCVCLSVCCVCGMILHQFVCVLSVCACGVWKERRKRYFCFISIFINFILLRIRRLNLLGWESRKTLNIRFVK